MRSKQLITWFNEGLLSSSHSPLAMRKSSCNRLKVVWIVCDRTKFFTMFLQRYRGHASRALVNSLRERFLFGSGSPSVGGLWRARFRFSLNAKVASAVHSTRAWVDKPLPWIIELSGASSTEYSGMKFLQEEHIPKNNIICFLVRGTGNSTMASMCFGEIVHPSGVRTCPKCPRKVTSWLSHCNLDKLALLPSSLIFLTGKIGVHTGKVGHGMITPSSNRLGKQVECPSIASNLRGY